MCVFVCIHAYARAHLCKVRDAGARLKTRYPGGQANDAGDLDQGQALVTFTDGLVKDASTGCGKHNWVKGGDFTRWEN